MDPLLPHYLYGCNTWPLYCHTNHFGCYSETLYCHHKYLVAIGCNSIATLNIVVTIGGAFCCHDKCLVARGCRSIAIDGSFYRHDQHLVSILGPSIATHIVSLVWGFCRTVCLLLYHILQYQMIILIWQMVASNNICTANNIWWMKHLDIH